MSASHSSEDMPTRPSLMSSTAAEPVRQGSVLQALSQVDGRITQPAHEPRQRGWLAGCALLTLLAVVLWKFSATPASSISVASSRSTSAGESVPIAVAQATQTAKESAEQTEAATAAQPPEAAARIESMQPSSVAARSTPIAAAPVALAATVAAPPEPSAVAREEQLRRAKPAQATPPPATNRKNAPTAQHKASSGDAEVEIVAALMRRLDGERGAAALSAPKQTAARVAEPCHAAGVNDVMACKHNACRGRWGKTEACPASDRALAERAARAQRTRN